MVAEPLPTQSEAVVTVEHHPTNLQKNAFKLVVTNIDSIQGIGTLVRGVVDGQLRVMDEVAIVRGQLFLLTMIRGIFVDPPHHTTHLDVATTGIEVQLSLQGVTPDEVLIGDQVVPPSAVPVGCKRR
jgi:translation elongation factor EF-Tu-like GTPase